MTGKKFWFEKVPLEERYWAVVQLGIPQSRSGEMELELEPPVSPDDLEAVEEVEEFMRRGDAFGFVPMAIQPELVQINPYKYGLVLYTSQTAAKEELRAIEERDPDEYLRLVDVYGQEQTDHAYSGTPPYRVVWTTATLLLEKLKELELAGLEGYGPPLEYVVVDGQQLERWSFTQGLERRVRESEE